MGKQSKVSRVLEIYEKLITGGKVDKDFYSDKFKVDRKTIQRDIEDINAYFFVNSDSKCDVEAKYNRKEKGYFIEKKGEFLNKKDVLAISKILLESRALNKDEMNHVIDSLLIQMHPEERKAVKTIIGNEKHNFESLQHDKNLLDILWELSECIRDNSIIEIDYVKMGGQAVKRSLKPLAIIFSEYYFYLIAYFKVKKSEEENPVVYRVDRIDKLQNTNEKFDVSDYGERFEDGKSRKRIQFMYTGDLETIIFEYKGSSLEAVLDRLPTAEVINELDNVYKVKAQVYGTGIKMWLLSQGSMVKVISPEILVEDMKNESKKIYELYNNA
ncbi:helix-turn-helix transcriptional regulator [Clostridium ihumii]|uniref:helix-turn-helix transcriptional regulator n=1 Tax=Clostridium ihumii TaxID=1470356 RepID=UPI003D35678E